MLKILEGTIASVPPQGGRKHPQQELIPIDTTNILFICGGAFEGIDRIIENRMDRGSIGFNAELAGENDKNISELLKDASAGFCKIQYDPGVYGTCADHGFSGSTGA